MFYCFDSHNSTFFIVLMNSSDPLVRVSHYMAIGQSQVPECDVKQEYYYYSGPCNVSGVPCAGLQVYVEHLMMVF